MYSPRPGEVRGWVLEVPWLACLSYWANPRPMRKLASNPRWMTPTEWLLFDLYMYTHTYVHMLNISTHRYLGPKGRIFLRTIGFLKSMSWHLIIDLTSHGTEG